MSSLLLCVALLLSLSLGVVADFLTQHVGSTSCASARPHTLQYTSGSHFGECAGGVLEGYGTIYATVSCGEGQATMQFWLDEKCSNKNGAPESFLPEEYSKFRSGGCAKTVSGCCSYDAHHSLFPDCFAPTTTEELTTTEKPTTTEDPTTTEKLTTTEEYTTTEELTTTEESTTTQKLATTEEPISTEEPTTTTVVTTTTTTTMTTTSTTHDCSVLPQSMNGPSHSDGCSGAVWSNGSPSKAYCDGTQHAWWAACCQWEENLCTEKPGTAIVPSTTTEPHDCTALPLSMNGPSHPSGCHGAVWSNGLASQSYCEGKQGLYPWWSACCQWEGSSCTEKEGSVAPQDCAAPPESMNGAAHPSGCSGAVWSNGDASKSYCEGKDGKYPWWAACCRWEGSSCKSKQVAAGGRRLVISKANISLTILV